MDFVDQSRSCEEQSIVDPESLSWRKICDFNQYYLYRTPIPLEGVVQLTRTEYVADFLRPKGLWSSLWAIRGPYILALYRSRRETVFSDEEVSAIEAISSHLNNIYSFLQKPALISRERLCAAELAEDCRLLTRRETEIVKIPALPMSAQEIASVLLVSRRYSGRLLFRSRPDRSSTPAFIFLCAESGEISPLDPESTGRVP